MAWTVIPGAGQGPGFNPYGKDYPFVDPPDSLRGLFADIYLNHDVYDVVVPLSVVFAYRFDLFMQSPPPPAGTQPALAIYDSEGKPVFESLSSSMTYSGRPFGNKLYVHEWSSDRTICRVVQHAAFNSEDEIIEYPTAVLLDVGEAVLDERVWELRPRHVTQLAVDTNTLKDDVIFVNGWNTEFEVGSDKTFGLRAGREITISAAPGSGQGRFETCDDTPPPIYTINGVGPDETGNFTLSADQCLLVYQPDVLSTLALGNVCHECAPCEAYENVYKALINVHRIYRAIGQRFQEVVDLYNQVRRRWLDQIYCRSQNVVRVDVLANGLITADADINICNYVSSECVNDVQLDFGVEFINDSTYTPMIIDGTVYTYRPETAKYEPNVALDLGSTSLGNHTWRIVWDSVPPGSRAAIRFRIRPIKNGTATDAYDGLKMRVCARVTYYTGPDNFFPAEPACQTLTWVDLS